MGAITCREWEELSVENNCLTATEVNRLHALAERAAKQLKLPSTAVLERTARGLKAGQVVGVLAIPGRTIEILPKIDVEDNSAVREALIHMLAVAHDLKVNSGELVALKSQRYDLLEFLIRLFAERLLTAVRRGLPHRYFTHEDDLLLLRGKLNVTRQVTHLAVRAGRLACRFDELSENMPLNRVLKAAVSLLTRLTRSPRNFRLLSELTSRLELVGDSLNPLREIVQLDRTNIAYRDLYYFARRFLEGDWQSTSGGSKKGFALLFAMNDLFERFIGRSLRRALAPNRTVHLQNQAHYALTSESVKSLFALRPDVVIDPTENPVILDTKWKRLVPGKESLDIDQSDIYQMIVYGQAYKSSRLILLYPWHNELTVRNNHIIRRWKVTGNNRIFDVATINVGRPDEVNKTLRDIVNTEQLCSRSMAPT